MNPPTVHAERINSRGYKNVDVPVRGRLRARPRFRGRDMPVAAALIQRHGWHADEAALFFVGSATSIFKREEVVREFNVQLSRHGRGGPLPGWALRRAADVAAGIIRE